MNELDRKLREALSTDDTDLPLGEPSLWEQVIAMFGGGFAG